MLRGSSGGWACAMEAFSLSTVSPAPIRSQQTSLPAAWRPLWHKVVRSIIHPVGWKSATEKHHILLLWLKPSWQYKPLFYCKVSSCLDHINDTQFTNYLISTCLLSSRRQLSPGQNVQSSWTASTFSFFKFPFKSLLFHGADRDRLTLQTLWSKKVRACMDSTWPAMSMPYVLPGNRQSSGERWTLLPIVQELTLL